MDHGGGINKSVRISTRMFPKELRSARERKLGIWYGDDRFRREFPGPDENTTRSAALHIILKLLLRIS